MSTTFDLMSDLISHWAETRPERLAVVTPDARWTYEHLNRRVAIAQRQLEQMGIDQGTRIGIHMPRGIEAVLLFWAVWRAGAVAVPLSTRLPSKEVVAQGQRVGIAVLVTTVSEVAETAPPTLPIRAPDVFVNGTEEPSRTPACSGDRSATILFTSGSSGSPKAALHTWANHLYSAKGANANIPLRPGDRWILSLPLYHVGGMAILVRCALAGATVVVPDQGAALSDAIRCRSGTHVSAVSTQFRRMLSGEGPPEGLKAVLVGGGPIPESLLRRGKRRGWPLHTTYGCTEMASQVTATSPGAPADDLLTAGRRLPHRRLSIMDEQIHVAGRPLFQGYMTEEGLVDPRTETGWYPTGDRGRIDATGRLHVLGRIDRMFVSGGENIQPEEIEAALERLDDVDRAIVVPIPDAEYGERPVAFVRGRDGISDTALRQALTDALPRFKIPDAFHSLTEEEGHRRLKIDRDRLRERARKLHE